MTKYEGRGCAFNTVTVSNIRVLPKQWNPPTQQIKISPLRMKIETSPEGVSSAVLFSTYPIHAPRGGER